LKLLSKAASAADLPETAVFSLETLFERRPSDRHVATELAEAYIAADRSADGLAIAERILNRNPGDMELQELLKRASVAQSISKGRWDSDSGSYRDKLRDEESAVLAEQSNKVILTDEMAQRLIDQGHEAIEAEPANLRNYFTVINGYRALRRFDEALEWLAKARHVPTGAGDVTLEKTETELKIARLEALMEQRSAVAAEDDEELRRLQLELDGVRIDSLKTLVEKYPTDLDFKFELGKLYRAAGKLDLAIQQFQSAQRNAKLRVAALTELGACFQGKGLLDLAVQQYQTAKNEINGFDETKKSVVYELATCLEAMNQKEKALVEYKLIYSCDISFRDVAVKIDQSYMEY
jgi:tetratricopeptide (TPR) repeat protein